MRKRSIEIKVRLNETEAERFKKQVQQSGLTRSAYLRQLISGRVPRALPPAEYYAMMQEVYHLEVILGQLREDLRDQRQCVEADRLEATRQEVVDGIRTITAAVLEPERWKSKE